MTKTQKFISIHIILIVLLLLGILIDMNSGYANLDVRLPRIVASLLVGIGLAVSGSVIQGVTHNDMAEPGILGINAGAGLFIAAFILFFQNGHSNYSLMMPVLSFLGSLAVFIMEYRLSIIHGKLHPKRFLLMGVAISLAITSMTTILMLKMPDSEYAFVQAWLAGNLWGAEWNNIIWLAIGVFIICFYIWYKSRTLNALNLGEEVATGIGVNVIQQSRLLLILAVALSSLCCAVGGGLSFVGLVCPHLARKLVGPNYIKLIPTTILLGADLLVLSDIISRTLFLPAEMPIGIVATVIGAPYFLYLLVKE